jgi:hypothetical protein
MHGISSETSEGKHSTKRDGKKEHGWEEVRRTYMYKRDVVQHGTTPSCPVVWRRTKGETGQS